MYMLTYLSPVIKFLSRIRDARPHSFDVPCENVVTTLECRPNLSIQLGAPTLGHLDVQGVHRSHADPSIGRREIVF